MGDLWAAWETFEGKHPHLLANFALAVATSGCAHGVWCVMHQLLTSNPSKKKRSSSKFQKIDRWCWLWAGVRKDMDQICFSFDQKTIWTIILQILKEKQVTLHLPQTAGLQITLGNNFAPQKAGRIPMDSLITTLMPPLGPRPSLAASTSNGADNPHGACNLVVWLHWLVICNRSILCWAWPPSVSHTLSIKYITVVFWVSIRLWCGS